MPDNWPEFQKWCAALCAWREARGEYHATNGDGIRAIIHVINNRAKLKKVSWTEIVYAKWQFSSMSADNDPQLTRVPSPPIDDAMIFTYCYRVADLVWNNQDSDVTNGATHYFNPSVVLPVWAKDMVKVASIGHHDFYRV